MTTAQRTFAQRIGYCITCVVPANLLSDEATDPEDSSNLRVDVSHEGLSYLQVSHALSESVYVCRVAASPDWAATGYTVLLTEQQLYFALPWDQRLEWEDHLCTQKRCSASILALLRASAAEVQPLTKRPPVHSEAATAPFTTTALTPLDTVEVSHEDVQDAIALVTKQGKNVDQKQRRTNQFQLQQALLSTMLDVLMEQLYLTQEHTLALTLKARCTLIAQIQRWHRQTNQERLVNAVARFSPERQQVVWRLTVGLPDPSYDTTLCAGSSVLITGAHTTLVSSDEPERGLDGTPILHRKGDTLCQNKPLKVSPSMMCRRRWEVDLLSRELTVTASDENIFAMLTDADYDYGNHVLVHFGRFFSNRIVARDRLHRKSLDRSLDR